MYTTAATQTPEDAFACTANDLKLVNAQRDSQKIIMDFIVPFMFPNEADSTKVSLFEVYEKFLKRANRTSSVSGHGFSKFIEAVNEITAAYTESCLVSDSSRPHLENFTEMVQEFGKAYEQKKTVEIRSVYGKSIYLDDQLRKLEQSKKRKRSQNEISSCDLDRLACKCPPGGIANVFCPCEFFDCLDQNNQLEPIFIGFEKFECLTFVVDTTGSMKDEIDHTVQILKDFIGSEEDLGCYMFVPFNDKDSDPDKSKWVEIN